MRHQVAEAELGLNGRCIPRQRLSNHHTTHGGNLIQRLINTVGLSQSGTGEEELPFIRLTGFPTDRYRIRLDSQINIRRRHAIREFFNSDLINIVDGVLAHLHHVVPHNSYHALRSVIILKISIATRISRCIEREMRYRHKGVDIHRVGHHTYRSMRLVKRSITAEIELDLHVTQVLHHRQRDPSIGTATFTHKQVA